MYVLGKPTETDLQKYVAQQSQQTFSYEEVGFSLKIERSDSDYLTQIGDQLRCQALPDRYTIDRNRIVLGSGLEVFEQAKIALCHWKMFNLDWIDLFSPETPIQTGLIVGILFSKFGIWSINFCKVIDFIQTEEKGIKKFGFAYGTLTSHGLSGEERFLVEWNQKNNLVHYDLFAFSRPNQLLTKIGYWYVRKLQRRFVQSSQQAMILAVN